MRNLEHNKQEGLGYLLELAFSYCKSKVLFVANDLDVFSVLSDSGKNAEKVALELGVEIHPIEILLNACVSLGLIEKKEGLYFNTSTSEMFLVKDKPTCIGQSLNIFDKRWYKQWDRLIDAVKANKPQAYEEGSGDLFEEMVKNKDEMYGYFQGLHALAQWPALSLARTFDFTPYRRLLDVGGGSGAYSMAIAKRHKRLSSVILDLQPVCEVAKEFIAKEGLSQQIETLPGDFFKDDFPQDADIILFSDILHGWNEKKVELLLNKAFESLPSKGGIIIRDMILNNDGTEPLHATLMSLTLLLEYKEGTNYTIEQYTHWLDKAGFREISMKQLIGPNRIMTAIKP